MGAPKGSCSSTGNKPPIPPTARSRKSGVRAGGPYPPCSRPRGDTPVRRTPGSSASALHIALCDLPMHTGSWCVPCSGIRSDWSKGPDPCRAHPDLPHTLTCPRLRPHDCCHTSVVTRLLSRVCASWVIRVNEVGGKPSHSPLLFGSELIWDQRGSSWPIHPRGCGAAM